MDSQASCPRPWSENTTRPSGFRIWVAAARPAAELMAEALGWDDAQLDVEVDHYLRRVEAERQSQLMPTDQEADEARVKAPEIV